MEKNIFSRNLIIAMCVAVVAATLVIVNGLIVKHQEEVALENSFIGSAATISSVPSGIDTGKGNSSSSTSSAQGGAQGTGRKPTTLTPQPPFTITFITPASGNTWQVAKSNSVSWNRAANVTGEMDLLDAGTEELIGVITSNTGPQQTSYSWDTRQIYLERYGALKKDIVPGTYLIRLKFDGNNLPNILSGPVKITL